MVGQTGVGAHRARAVALVALLALLAGCGESTSATSRDGETVSTRSASSAQTPAAATSPTPTGTTPQLAERTSAPHHRDGRKEPRRHPGDRAPGRTGHRRATTAGRARFYVHDRHHYRSPWYAGRHRVMIGFGCTRAPYYDPDPSCAHRHGSHHGIDVAMPCGNPLFAGIRGRVLRPTTSGTLGAAYGPHAFRIRNPRRDIDIIIGHVRRVFVDPGDRVRRDDRIARASDAGAPDGCHLHLETRPAGGGYTSATDPSRVLALHR